MVEWDSTAKLRTALDTLEGVTGKHCKTHKPLAMHQRGVEWCYCCGAIKVDGDWMLPQSVKP